MTSLLNTLKSTLVSCPTVDFQQPKNYQLLIVDELLSFRNQYASLLDRMLQGWLQTVHKSLVAAMSSKQINQIKPKLQLIYTSCFNQRERVKQEIEKIGTSLVQQTYRFENDLQDNDNKENKNNRTASQTNGFGYSQQRKSNTTLNPFSNNQHYTADSFLRPQNRNRSSSAGMRRKLSKTSCFAQAKKVPAPSGLQLGGKGGSSKIKKTKKREENAFDGLQKCLSSTSPSNFMLNYLARTQNQEDCKSNRLMIDQLKQSLSRSRSKTKEGNAPEIVISRPIENNFRNAGNHVRTDSEGYMKVMANLEQKIGVKLDQLVQKYTKIQQKLEQTSYHPPLEASRNESAKPTIPTTNPNLNHTTIYHNNIPSIQSPPTASMVQKEKTQQNSPKVSLVSNNQKDQSRISVNRPTNKAVHGRNKIVRNRTEESVPSEGEVETIRLQAKDQEKKDNCCKGVSGDHKQIQKNKEQERIGQQKSYIQYEIEKFKDITGKVVLAAVTGKFIHVLKTKYLTFCTHHQLPPSSTISNYPTQPLAHQTNEMKDSLHKMQKILTLNCGAEKKEKMLAYVRQFLHCYLSFSGDGLCISQQEEQDVEALINKALGRLSESKQ